MVFCISKPAYFFAVVGLGATVALGMRAESAIIPYYHFGRDVPASAATNIRNSVDAAIAVFNEWSNYDKAVHIYYNPGVPTAQASFNGDITFGAGTQYHTPSTAWHEMLHVMGSGTYSTYWNHLGGGGWTGAQGIAMTEQYYPGSTLVADNHIHWVSGHNPDFSRAGVHIMGAMRADMGLPNGNKYDVPGDLDDNKSLGPEDYFTLVGNMHSDIPPDLSGAEAYALGDMTGDGAIDFYDFRSFTDAYMRAYGGRRFSSAIGVPEPDSVTFTVLSVLALLATRNLRWPKKAINCR